MTPSTQPSAINPQPFSGPHAGPDPRKTIVNRWTPSSNLLYAHQRTSVKKLKQLVPRFKRELRLYRNILADPRTPKLTKWLLASAVAYAITPIDIIPDFIPVIGHLDDAVIVPVLIFCALKAIPKPLLEEHRRALPP